jgi:hypothetical protein
MAMLLEYLEPIQLFLSMAEPPLAVDGHIQHKIDWCRDSERYNLGKQWYSLEHSRKPPFHTMVEHSSY